MERFLDIVSRKKEKGRGDEGTRERGNEGTKGRRNEGTKERGNEGTKERRDDNERRGKVIRKKGIIRE